MRQRLAIADPSRQAGERPSRELQPDEAITASLADELAGIRAELREIRRLLQSKAREVEGGFLDARAAATYCGMSRGTFDKYRYTTEVKLKGHRLDGKMLYKREELDAFIRLYEIKSAGAR